MKLALAEEIKNIDKKATEEANIPSIVLMENAGRAVFEMAAEMFERNLSGKKICVFAGKGNNAGDAFVAARYLLNNGVKVKLFLLAPEELFSADAQTAFSILKTMQPDISLLANQTEWDKMKVQLAFCDLVIDGLLGTGFHGTLEGEYASAVEAINNCRKPVLSIDIPSGIEADSGKAASIAVMATNTVTLALPKPGLFMFPGKAYAGRVSVAPIGVPNNIIDDMPIQQKLITNEMVACYLPRRSLLANKNQFRAAVVAGSKGMIGAAALCSEAALRIGAGLVKLLTAQNAADILSMKLTEVMVDTLAADDDGLTPGFVDVLLEKTTSFSVVAVGPGLGIREGTKEFVCDFIQNTDKTLVLDADALNAIAGKTELLTKTKELAVITPHLGEMARLTGLSIEQIEQEGILRIARRFAIEWQTIVVLKGVPTIVALPDGEAFINTTGNPGMATAGSGDVLTGVIAGLIAQGLEPAPAAVCGVYLHSLAADIVAQDAMMGMAAGDILSALPQALKYVAAQVC